MMISRKLLLAFALLALTAVSACATIGGAPTAAPSTAANHKLGAYAPGWSGPSGGGGGGTVTSVNAGTNVTISGTATDPIVNASGTVTNVTGTAPIASSGGATPNITIAAATTSVAGSQSAADKTLTASQQAEWQNIQIQRCQALDATLTGIRRVPVGVNAPGTTALAALTGDANIEGGGLSGAGRFYGASVLQNAATAHFCAVIRVRFNAQSAGAFSQAGFSNGANSHVMVVEVNGTDSTTNFRYRLGFAAVTKASMSQALDSANYHDVMIRSDGTTMTFYIDNVSGGSTASSNATNEPLYLYSFDNINQANFKLNEIVYLYVPPT